MLSQPNLFPLFTEQEVTMPVEEPAFLNSHLYDSFFPQDTTGGGLAQTSIDPMLGSVTATDADLVAWGWSDPSSLVYPPALQQEYSSAQMAPSSVIDDVSTAQTDPAAWAWSDQSDHVHEPTLQQNQVPSAVQCQGCGSEALDKVNELRAMMFELEARTEQRMALVEETASDMQRRLVTKTGTPRHG